MKQAQRFIPDSGPTSLLAAVSFCARRGGRLALFHLRILRQTQACSSIAAIPTEDDIASAGPENSDHPSSVLAFAGVAGRRLPGAALDWSRTLGRNQCHAP